ncbi:TlpA family protein disulfide reductase [Marivirga lumbricoides]
MKKSIIEYGVILSVFGILYLTGLHTEVLGFVQRGVLVTGLLNPDVTEQEKPSDNFSNPKADFSMQLINSKGEKLDMKSLKGKVIFLNIWASWCPPCLAEMPGINKLYQSVDKNKVAFIMLSVDDDFSKAIKLHRKKEFDFEIFQAPGGIPRLYHTQSIPTTYIIDAKGDLVLTHSGMGDFNTEEFRSYLKSLQ